MTWKNVNSDGMPKDDGEYLVAYRAISRVWSVVTDTCTNEKFLGDYSPPYVEYWMEIPPLPEPGRR